VVLPFLLDAAEVVLRVFLARRRMDVAAVVEEAHRLLAPAAAADAARLGLGEDVRAAALICLVTAEIWALRFEDAERHLEQLVSLARRIGRPYLEFWCLVHWMHGLLLFRREALQPERVGQAIELAERNGWDQVPLAGIAYTVLAGALLYQGRLAEAEPWLERAERTLHTEADPAAGVSLFFVRAVLEMARGRYREALAAFRAAEKLAAELVLPNVSVTSMRSRMLHTLVRVGETERAEAALAELDSRERASAEMRTAAAALRLAQDDPQTAADELAPVLDDSVPGMRQVQYVTALLLEALARDRLCDQAAGRALERALDITGSSGMVLPFLLDPAPALLRRHRPALPAGSAGLCRDRQPAHRGADRARHHRRAAARRGSPARLAPVTWPGYASPTIRSPPRRPAPPAPADPVRHG
jgi:LuxR family transcriptional regulator, maltose regulon positive regulatory protein